MPTFREHLLVIFSFQPIECHVFFLSIFLETVLHEVYSRLYTGKYILVVEYRFVTTEKALIRKLRSRGENFEN